MSYWDNINDLLNELDKMPSDATITPCLGEPHSWRGDYAQLALEPQPGGMDVAELRDLLKSQIGAEYTGYKGGDFVMNGSSQVWIDYYGQASGPRLSVHLLRLMAGQPFGGI